MIRRIKEYNQYILCLIFSFICITINSKMSFLYEYQDVEDVHCFITTARCMLRGDVLYRDVYEHKGPLHYFLYCIGLLGSDKTMIGIYVIEIILFAFFLAVILKTMQLFCKKELFNILVVAIIAMWSTVSNSFTAGGECEELTLPFVSMSFYLALKSCKEDNEDNKNSTLIGICFAMVFWSKYTLTGSFAGYALAVLIVGVLKKDIYFVIRKAGCFLTGAVLGSLPVIIYFSVTSSFADLWEVYFYNLIFKYNQTETGSLRIFNNILNMINPWIIIALVGMMFVSRKKLKTEGKIIFAFMALFTILEICIGKIWSYTYETLYVFCVFTVIGVIGVFQRLLSVKSINGFVNDKRTRFCKRLKAELDEKTSLKRTLVKIKHVLSIKPIVYSAICLYMVYFTFTASNSIPYISYKVEDYACGQISEFVLKRKPESPIILSFTSLDTGIYYLTGTYPPDKYFCSYNLFKVKDLGYYDKYIKTGIADYVVTSGKTDRLEEYGYQIAMETNALKTEITVPINLYLYARKDLF